VDYESPVINYLERSAKPRHEYDIINSLKSTKPFCEIAKYRNKKIRDVLVALVNKKRIKSYQDDLDKWIYVLAK